MPTNPLSVEQGVEVSVSPPGTNLISRDADALDEHPALFVKQTRKGCVQECLGCDANSEFNVATLDEKNKDIFYITENSGCCVRFWCGGNRPWNTSLHKGNDKEAPLMANYVRPLRCPMGSCKCCCFQEVETHVGNSLVGTTVESFYLCVPSFDVKDISGNIRYTMHMPTCCGGICVNICKEGLCNCRIPFYIYAPDGGDEVGKIVKVWSGLATEILTDADKLELQFPKDADVNMKATLLGSTLMINQLFFEKQKE